MEISNVFCVGAFNEYSTKERKKSSSNEADRQRAPRFSPCVGGVMVSIVAFQAVDPGSIPGRRRMFFLRLESSCEASCTGRNRH